MKVVIKIGGAAEESSLRGELARQIAGLRRSGCDVVVVHGGGKLLTETLARLGLPTAFSNGLRVTDAETRDAALMVLAGLVNKRWVAEIEMQKQKALGICGGDGKLVEALPWDQHSHRSPHLGLVGRPRKVNPALLDLAFGQSMIPVVASVALGPKGEYLNVNADDFAGAIARALRADRLIVLTDSGGVRDAEGKLLPRVRAKEISVLIRRGIVRDGMIPKLLACRRVLAGKVGEIDIVSPSSDLGTVLGRRHSTGTAIVG